MSKFGSKRVAPARRGPISTPTAYANTLTHERASAFTREAKSDLFLLAATNMVGEDTFYEQASERDRRFVGLVHEVTANDPDWVARFVPFLRNEMNMRSASVVMAAEYVFAGGPNGRAVVANALQRADEPAEMLAYWTQAHGRRIPKPIKRGVADAANRLYTEYAALKYDGSSRAWRMGDVIDLVHPAPVGHAQSALYKWLLDTRHNRDEIEVPENLQMIHNRRALEAMDVAERRSLIENNLSDARRLLKDAGMTWESLSGWLQGPMSANAWEAMIPSMGYMALLRNLRNFDQAGVSNPVAKKVGDILADPANVAKSRQFPFRFLSAYENVTNDRWAWPLNQALEASVQNVPALKGKTLILVDRSGSMDGRVSNKSTMSRARMAGVFAAALALKNDATLVGFGHYSREIRFPKGTSIMPLVDGINRLDVGHATYMWTACREHFDNHDRVVILTDDQAHDQAPSKSDVPIYTFNLAGYAPSSAPSGTNGFFTFGGGLNDATFRMLKMLDEAGRTDWPF